MVFGSANSFDNHFNIAQFLSFLAYFAILIGLIIDYTCMFSKKYESQNFLISKTAELDKLAHLDHLTGLANRLSFDKILSFQQNYAQQTKTHFALFFIDIDNFKSINDKYGHDVGDTMLNLVGQRINKCIYEDDRLFRLGGDEFAIIMNGL